MVNRIIRWSLILACLAGVLWLALTLWPSPEKQIRKRLVKLAELASVSAGESDLAAVANARGLASLFATNAVVQVDVQGGPHGRLSDREEIFQVALGARRALGVLRVEFLDVEVKLSGDKRAATVEATGKATQPGVRDVFWQELKFQFRLQDSGWVIERVETVRTLTWRLPIGTPKNPRVDRLHPDADAPV